MENISVVDFHLQINVVYVTPIFLNFDVFDQTH